MYEQFGACVDKDTGEVTFKLFLPDAEKAPYQYEGGGSPRIRRVFVVGSFQDPETRQWDLGGPLQMTPSDYRAPASGQVKGVLYSCTTAPLPDGFYEYKYRVQFGNGVCRFITDPCARYAGTANQRSGFVVGPPYETVNPLRKPRLAMKDLVIYELMIDDFTARMPERDPNEAPLESVIRKLDDLKKLGINAIEFMPWIAWTRADDPATSGFGWGYNPAQYFAAAHRYTLNRANETSKLVALKRLINECHARDIQVIMDGVFNHAEKIDPDLGFPYYWLYEDPADSPYVGNFAQADFGEDLDYANACTLEYIRDACIYWIDTFKIDGIRFDNTAGMYRTGDRGHGISKLLSELRGHLARTKNRDFALILEHEWDYRSVDVTNKVGATSCWLDKYRQESMKYLGQRPNGVPQIEPDIMRMLNSGKDFAPGRAPTIYIENHDHQRFMIKAGGREYWPLTQPYIIALFTCAGAPLIYNGQEFGQDNDMPENGDGRVVPRPVRWEFAADGIGPQVWERYRQMMRIRREHPGLRSGNFHPCDWQGWMRKPDGDGFGVDCDRNVVVYHRWGEDDQGRLERFYVVLNFSDGWRDVSFRVPDDGPWEDLLSGYRATANDGWMNVGVGSNWGAIYWRRYE